MDKEVVMADVSGREGSGTVEQMIVDVSDDDCGGDEQYEFDFDDIDFNEVDLEKMIDSKLQQLDLEEESKQLISPIRHQISTIEKTSIKASKIFEDAERRLDKIIKSLTDKKETAPNIIHLSDNDSDDDIQFVSSTKSTSKTGTSHLPPHKQPTTFIKLPNSKGTLQVTANQMVMSRDAAGKIHYVPLSSIKAVDGQNVNWQQVLMKQGQSGQPRHLIIQHRQRVPFYKTIKQLPLMEMKLNMKVLAKKGNDIWYKGNVQDMQAPDTENPDGRYRVKFDGKGWKLVTGKEIAIPTVDNETRLPLGTRVVAQYRDEDATPAISHYAGIVAESPSVRNLNRYLIFFDDGYAQYNHIKTVHRVYRQSENVWEDIHPDSQEFIKSYLLSYPERPMVRLQVGQYIKTEWNGEWWKARVQELDASLVKMFFDADQRIEWIYRGSTRLEPLYTELANAEANKVSGGKGRIRHNLGMRKKNKPYVEYTRGTESDDELQIIDKVEPPTQQTARKSTGRSVAKKSTGGSQNHHQNTSSSSSSSYLSIMTKQTTSPGKKEFTSTSPAKEHSVRRQVSALVGPENHGERIDIPLNKLVPNRQIKKYVKHVCSMTCSEEDDPTRFRGHNPLRIPLLFGWNRHLSKVRNTSGKRYVIYSAPCQRRLRSMEDLMKYLDTTSSSLSCDMFCFDPYIHVLSEFVPIKTFCDIKDISYGKETVPISCVNGIDRQYPDYVEYSNQRIPAKGVKLNLDTEFLACCNCTDNCQDKSKCACCQLTWAASAAIDPQGRVDEEAGYEYRRLKHPLITGVYECNSRCGCDQRCHNRVAQNGLQLRLQVFKTEKRGWGIRCLDDIPAGGFICIYAGQLLTEQAANEDGHQYGDEYLAELDHIEVVEQIKEGFEDDVDPIDEDLDDNETSDDSVKTESDIGSDYSGHAAVKFDTDEAPVHNTRRRSNRRRLSKDRSEPAGKVGKIVIKCTSSTENKTWAVNKKNPEKDTATTTTATSTDKAAKWLDSLPDAAGAITISDDEEKKDDVGMDTDELPDLAPDGTVRKPGKSNQNTAEKQPAKSDEPAADKTAPSATKTPDKPSSDPADMVHDSDDSDEGRSNKVEKTSRFMNLPDPKTPIPSLKIKLSTMEVQKDKTKGDKDKKLTIPLRSFFNEEFCYIMDAKSIGNLGRYLNHSCTPNVFVQNVFVDTHDLRFPWVGFFSLQLIRAGTELTWDYNYEVGSVPGKVLYCYCGSAECRGRLL
ncbi:histone-lysine N-methyltransferase SETDB1-like isoform X2 [Tubulanus polymorphus]|uniref:histone-lysine N-methyltransferase SETDB1-like isoform X2 n=1 Tax=Tubulanus polymorphus TaxID=672921 RepID=UPI003DA234E1